MDIDKNSPGMPGGVTFENMGDVDAFNPEEMVSFHSLGQQENESDNPDQSSEEKDQEETSNVKSEEKEESPDKNSEEASDEDVSAEEYENHYKSLKKKDEKDLSDDDKAYIEKYEQEFGAKEPSISFDADEIYGALGLDEDVEPIRTPEDLNRVVDETVSKRLKEAVSNKGTAFQRMYEVLEGGGTMDEALAVVNATDWENSVITREEAKDSHLSDITDEELMSMQAITVREHLLRAQVYDTAEEAEDFIERLTPEELQSKAVKARKSLIEMDQRVLENKKRELEKRAEEEESLRKEKINALKDAAQKTDSLFNVKMSPQERTALTKYMTEPTEKGHSKMIEDLLSLTPEDTVKLGYLLRKKLDVSFVEKTAKRRAHAELDALLGKSKRGNASTPSKDRNFASGTSVGGVNFD